MGITIWSPPSFPRMRQVEKLNLPWSPQENQVQLFVLSGERKPKTLNRVSKTSAENP